MTQKRDWRLARAKVEAEGRCRVCGGGPVEAAHVIGRKHDPVVSSRVRLVLAEAVVPLCRDHHMQYDAHDLDLLPCLTSDEQARAVRDAGGIIAALRRTTGERP